MLPVATYSPTYAPIGGVRVFRGQGVSAASVTASGPESGVRDQEQRLPQVPKSGDDITLDLARQRVSVPFAFLPEIPEAPLVTYSASFMAQLLGQDAEAESAAANLTARLFSQGAAQKLSGLVDGSESLLFAQFGAANDNVYGFARTTAAKSKPLTKASGFSAYATSNQRLRETFRV